MNGICKMCGAHSKLCESHIIPRSYYKRLKKGGGQLLIIKNDQDTLPKLSNSDPKENLLCFECEQFLSVEYERSGVRLFKPTRSERHRVVPMGQYVKFKRFLYRETYLYFLSILWRASVSSLPQYAGIFLGGFEPLVRECIREKKLAFHPQIRVDYLIKIGIMRMVDYSGQVSDEILKKGVLDLSSSHGESVREGVTYFFMVDGFLVVYMMKAEGWRSQ